MIIIMGAIGSGKSEQAIRLAKKLGCPRISTSQLLRDNLTPEREAKMRAGELVNDQEVMELLDVELQKIGAGKTECVLDGAPRSLVQAEWLKRKFDAGEVKLTAIIKLNVSKQSVLERLQKRSREDDKEEIILKRLADYEAITTPVIDYFRQNNIEVTEVNGELSLDEVEQEIANAINKIKS